MKRCLFRGYLKYVGIMPTWTARGKTFDGASLHKPGPKENAQGI